MTNVWAGPWKKGAFVAKPVLRYMRIWNCAIDLVCAVCGSLWTTVPLRIVEVLVFSFGFLCRAPQALKSHFWKSGITPLSGYRGTYIWGMYFGGGGVQPAPDFSLKKVKGTYLERESLDEGQEAPCREKPWRSQGSNQRHQIAWPIGSTALYQLSQSPSTTPLSRTYLRRALIYGVLRGFTGFYGNLIGQRKQRLHHVDCAPDCREKKNHANFSSFQPICLFSSLVFSVGECFRKLSLTLSRQFENVTRNLIQSMSWVPILSRTCSVMAGFDKASNNYIVIGVKFSKEMN